MNTQHTKSRNEVFYHIYLNLHGPDHIYKALFDYLKIIGAQQIGRDYPELWYFNGSSEDRHKYEQEIFAAINSNIPHDIHNHPEVAWRVFIMGPNGHNGCGGGSLPQPFSRA